MGLYTPCYSVSGASVEVLIIETYDEAAARAVTPTNPGFDDFLGEPFLVDTDPIPDGIGDRSRPGTVVKVEGKVDISSFDRQMQDQVGNAPTGLMKVTVSEEELVRLGLLADGIAGIRANDRLLRVEDSAGNIRADFSHAGRLGLFCFEFQPGGTGSGIWIGTFEQRRPVAR